MKKATFEKMSRIFGVLLAAAILMSACAVGVSAAGASVSAASAISTYVCDFENGSYGSVSDKANTGSVETDESGNSYFEFKAPTNSDTYRFEVYNSASGDLVLKEGNFYCVTVKYKVENISSTQKSDMGTSINVARHDNAKGNFVKIKGFTGANYMPGTTTDWVIQSVVFKATLGGAESANRLAVNVTSPSCGTTDSGSDSTATIILMDDITVYECVGTTAAIDFQTNGGDFCEPILAQPGEAVTLPTPTKRLYDFGGWYTDTQCTARFTATTMPNSLVTRLYAKWTISDAAISINFDPTGGEAVEPLAGAEGDPLSLPKTARPGYNFGGWYNADFTERYTAAAFPAADTTLYAKWEPIAMFAGFENADSYDKPNNGSFTQRCILSKDDKFGGEYSLYYDYELGSGSAYPAWAGVQLLDEYNEKYSSALGQTYKLTFKYKVIEVTHPGSMGIVLSEKPGCWNNRTPLDEEELGDKWIEYDQTDVGKGWQEASIIFTSRFEVMDAGYVAIGIGGYSKLYLDDFVLAPYDERFPVSDKCMLVLETSGGELLDTVYGDYGEVLDLPTPVREGYKFVDWFTDTAFTNAFNGGTFTHRYMKLYADWVEIVAQPEVPETDEPEPVPDEETDAKTEDKGLDTTVIIIIVAVSAVVVIAAAVVVIVLVRKKKKPASAEAETETATEEQKTEEKEK